MKATIGLAAFEPERPPPVTCERGCPKTDVGDGSWLCENAKTLNRDRRSYSSKTFLVAQRASGFNLEIELKNITLRRVSIFEFLHSQGQSLHGRPSGKSGHVGYGSESGSEFRAISGSARGRCGLMALPGRYSSFETGASNHALRIQRT